MSVFKSTRSRIARLVVLVFATALTLSACEFSPYSVPLPGGADTGDDPYTITVEFDDVLDLVPQSGVRVDDVAAGRVTDIELQGWHAQVTLKINSDAKVAKNAGAKIRQTSLLGEKFVSLEGPDDDADELLADGDVIGLENSGRNPEIEEVLGAASLLLNGGGIDKVSTIVKEVNHALDGNEADVKELVHNADTLVSQLDDHKGQIINALEKIDRVSVQADKQSESIIAALDTVPDAVDVLNEQRDDLVTLLDSLNDFGEVGAHVIRRSKADLVENLRDLQPVLMSLNDAGDDLITSLHTLPTFPFSDQVVGGSYAKANGVCTHDPETGETTYEGACMGDYENLYAQLNLSAESLSDTIGNLVESLGHTLSDPGSLGLPGADQLPTDQVPGLDELPNLIGGLAQQGDSGSTDDNSGSGEPNSDGSDSSRPSQDSQEESSSQGSPKLCSVLQLCRPAAAGTSDHSPGGSKGSDDGPGGAGGGLKELMLQPVVEP